MLYKHNIDHCLANNGNGSLLSASEYQSALKQTTNIIEQLHGEEQKQPTYLFALPNKIDDIAKIEKVAKEISEQFSRVIVLGTGGSSLNGRALAHLNYFCSANTKIEFWNGIDADSCELLFTNIDPLKTAFICISKSGCTSETIAQLFAVLEFLSQAIGIEYWGKHLYVITTANENPIRNVAQKVGATILDHEPIGGRFSTLSNVGLLPAATIGLSAQSFRKGAAETLKDFFQTDYSNSQVARSAAANFALLQKGYHISVMMPYIDRLASFAKWYRLIYAESIGKDGKGMTPINGKGTIDQHSQLQLYLGGPRDKIFTLINLELERSGPQFSSRFITNSTSYLEGRTMGELMYAEQQATIQNFISYGCPLQIIKLKKLNEEVLGGLMMHYILEIIVMARLLSVDPFDQPHVEGGKILVRQSLSNLKV
jgi:glucose-6-phosphate isomerase